MHIHILYPKVSKGRNSKHPRKKKQVKKNTQPLRARRLEELAGETRGFEMLGILDKL